ncbi:hypothetical protein D8674_041435 [Pyrus ussuriensis x Pyrus communis]|uniref:CCHC-type domain-containing protein n=1 Tax=Pyrus ussuriensis x Pyrus communis TaxID=2448454 RepID=A0A5N5FL42_9ROSA|nr:hypothetical protein D8674_041435 [Pyrus ussuriensis x Pyrus communis]
MVGSCTNLRAPIFTGVNYELWCIRMKTIFKSHNLWSFTDEKQVLISRDAKALGLIQGAMSDKIFPRITNQETVKNAWDVLKQEFKAILFGLVNKMKMFGETLPNKRLAEKMLISLTPTYDNIVSVIAFSSLSIQNKSGSQTTGYKGKKPLKFRDKKSDFKENTRKACKICGNIHYGECRFEGKPKCHNCGRFNHFARNCRSKPEETSMFFACNSATIVKSKHVWYIDSGCSNHMTSHELGHLNFNSLQLLFDKEMVLGLPKLKKSSGVCEGCIVGKQHRDAFNKKLTWRASKHLELIHSNVCGPMQTKLNLDETIKKHKARLVAKGYT